MLVLFTVYLTVCTSLVLNSNVYAYTDECPEFDGSEEFRQFIRFYEIHAGLLGQGLTPDEVLGIIADEYIDNPRWLEENGPYKHQVDTGLQQNGRTYRLKIKITETKKGSPTWGGSSFRTEVFSDKARVMCPFRDFFNGTYLICCDIVDSPAVLTLYHEHFNFSAYEAYRGRGSDFTRKVNKLLLNETVTTPKKVISLREDYESCWNNSMNGKMGYWVRMDEDWEWVYDGCMFQQMTRTELRSCIANKYNGLYYGVGESHIRNLFYYIAYRLDDELEVANMSKAHHDIFWKDYRFSWVTSAWVMEKTLLDYIEDSKEGTAPKLLILDLGVWPILSRPLMDYVFAMQKISYMLRVIKDMGTYVIFQQMPALPDNPFSNRYDISNHLDIALNYYVCKRLEQVSEVECSPNFYASLAFSRSDEMVCPGMSHTMCFTTEYEVIPPGRVVTEYAVKRACT